MEKYIVTKTEIRSLLHEIFYKLNGKAFTKHEKWPRLLEVSRSTNEIKSLLVSTSFNPDMPLVCTPTFIDGFEERYFSNMSGLLEKQMLEIDFKHRPHWQNEDFKQLYDLLPTLDSLKEVKRIVLNILKRGENFTLVSGAISESGGTGSREKNLELFHQEIISQSEEGHTVFNQMPLEKFFGDLHEFYPDAFTDGNPIIEEVYRPALESGKITRLKMMDNWETSGGAKDEYQIAFAQRIAVVLPDGAMAPYAV